MAQLIVLQVCMRLNITKILAFCIALKNDDDCCRSGREGGTEGDRKCGLNQTLSSSALRLPSFLLLPLSFFLSSWPHDLCVQGCRQLSIQTILRGMSDGDAECGTGNGITGQKGRTGQCSLFGPLFHFLGDILRPHLVH